MSTERILADRRMMTASSSEEQDPALVVSYGGTGAVLPVRVVSRREFTGSWEYLVEGAIFTSPPHPAWIEPAEWLGGGAAARFPLHLVSSQPRHKLHSQMDAGPVSARGKTAGRETIAINPADARERGIADGEVVRVFNALQRSRGVFRRCGDYRCRAAGSGSALVRRLVCPLRAWQRQCPDTRPRHLAPRPGAEFGDGTGGSGAVHDAANRQSLRAGAGSRGGLTRRAKTPIFRPGQRSRTAASAMQNNMH